MTDQNTDTTFDNQVGMWAEKIPSIEKATTKRIYQFALFMILGGLIVYDRCDCWFCGDETA
jgi:hypothetical protein